MIFEKLYNINDNIIIKRDIEIGCSKNGVYRVAKKNEKGKIIDIIKGIYNNYIYGIEFEEKNKFRHNLSNKCKQGHGFYVMSKYIKSEKK